MSCGRNHPPPGKRAAAARHLALALCTLAAHGVLAAPTTPTPGPAARVGDALDRAWNAISDELTDAILKTKIRIAMLEHLGPDGLRVQIDVRAGTVDLAGEVGRRANQKLAEQVTASISGVNQVHNRITLAPAPGPGGPPVTRVVGKLERGLADALLEARVKGRLLEQLGKVAFKVDVGATDGVVSLSGTVPDEAREELAVRIARETTGVKELHDFLKREN